MPIQPYMVGDDEAHENIGKYGLYLVQLTMDAHRDTLLVFEGISTYVLYRSPAKQQTMDQIGE